MRLSKMYCFPMSTVGGARDLIVVEGVNATLPSLSLKYSHDHANMFLGGPQHP